MSDFTTNISADAVLQQLQEQKESKKTSVTFDKKNYLNTRLEKGQTSKTLTIRLLPFTKDSSTPFFKVYTHMVRVNKEIAPNGWKTFICPAKNNVEGQTNHSCPFCETAKEARELKFNTTDQIQKEKYGKVEFANSARESWVVRCIERGHEEDGVKFWLFNHSKKGDGIYDKIMNIFQRRYSKGLENGEIRNIFDLEQGKDIQITVTLDTNNKTIINVVDDDDYTPLTKDIDLANQWINDSKAWTDVYSIKPYDFMSIIIEGGVPVFNKELNKYVNKEEVLEQKKADEEKKMAQYVEPSKEYESIPNQVSVFSPITGETVEPWNEPHNKASQQEMVTTVANNNSSTDDDVVDDLPF